MLKHLPATLAFAAAMTATAGPAAGGQDAAVTAARAAETALIWAVMILGFVSAGALLRHDRRVSRAQAMAA